ncbi:MAG: CotS family spore coat protein [Lachnospiraceae bacterium]|nr:CotS family spore coat protein [Lachnospiraceae bacterium]
MNDKAINVLEQYDMTINRTFKGRGTIICDTEKGMRVLKEYKGKTEKLELLLQLQKRLGDSLRTDTLIRNKEGALYVRDIDNSVYILEEQVEGKECSYKSEEDIVKACSAMAKLHLKFMTPVSYTAAQEAEQYDMPVFFYADEMEKHTTECKRVRNYLRKLRTKTDFERALLREYDYFLEKAVDVTKRAKEESKAEYEAYVHSNGLYCHGDYQYHNVLFGKGSSGAYTGIINLEHFAHDTGARDFYLLFRKISEKCDWSVRMAECMLDAYQNRRAFPPIEWRSLCLRLEYPEKFWKIINFYYNSRKSWMPNRNFEKLEGLIKQEKNKERLLERLF